MFGGKFPGSLIYSNPAMIVHDTDTIDTASDTTDDWIHSARKLLVRKNDLHPSCNIGSDTPASYGSEKLFVSALRMLMLSISWYLMVHCC